MKQPFAAGVRSKFKWLESLVHKLGKRVGRQLPNASNGDINRLLDLTSLARVQRCGKHGRGESHITDEVKFGADRGRRAQRPVMVGRGLSGGLSKP